MGLFWLSFVDPQRPQGERFLGVALIEVEEPDGAGRKDVLKAVLQKAWATACNPGGEVEAHRLPLDEMPNDRRVRLARAPRNTLMSPEDLQHHDLI